MDEEQNGTDQRQLIDAPFDRIGEAGHGQPQFEGANALALGMYSRLRNCLIVSAGGASRYITLSGRTIRMGV